MKEKTSIKPLTARQLFGVKKENLEKKVIDYYESTKNARSVVEYAVAILVRNAVVMSDFSGLFQTLIREIFLLAEPTDALRTYCIYFKDYFKSGEWDQIIRRLFGNKKNYHQNSDVAVEFAQRLKKTGSGVQKHPDLMLRLVSVFEDSCGKKHTLTIKDADETKTKEEVEGILEILTTLSIFEIKGVHQFEKFVKVGRPGVADTFEEDSNEGVINETIEELPVANSLGVSASTNELGKEASLASLNDRADEGNDEKRAEFKELPSATDQAAAIVVTPPEGKKKNRKPNNPKQAYVQSLIKTFSQKVLNQRE